MANGEYGVVGQMYRGLGIGSIKPDKGGKEVIFSARAVKGGESGFRNLAQGDRVSFRKYPTPIVERDFAEDVTPIS
jgi:cold shock CspA family protein